jgi:O-antigen/teichoic acid export membrane protein
MRITEVLYPTLVRRHTRGDGHGFDRALIDSIRYEVVGMLLIASAIGGAAHSVLDVFGPGFGRATAALALLMLFPMLASVAGTQTQALWATDRPGLTSLVAALRLIVTIGLLVMLTPSLGMIGPALALLAGYVAGIVASGIALHRFLTRPSRATWPLRERLSLVLAYGAGFVAANLGEHALGSIAALPLCLIAGIAAYAVVFVLSGGVNQRDRERLTLVLAAVRSRRRAAAVGPAPASSGTEGSSQPDGRQAAPTKLSA